MRLQERDQLGKLRGDMPDGAIVVVVGNVDDEERHPSQLGHGLCAHNLRIARRIDAHRACGRWIEAQMQGSDRELVGRATIAGDTMRLRVIDEIKCVAGVSQQIVNNAECLDWHRAHIAEGVKQLGIEAEIIPDDGVAPIQMVEK